MTKREPIKKVETPKVDFSNMNLPQKPDSSEFECFGCSS